MMWKGEWRTNPPCSEEAIQRLVESATVELPPEYLAYLRESNGGGGDIGVEPGLLYFWQTEEVSDNNNGYEVQQNVPGFYAFGSSGGGEMFAFDTRGPKPWPVVIIPFIPMDAEVAIQIARDFSSLTRSFGVPLDEPPEEPPAR
jgi:hypothetical protein